MNGTFIAMSQAVRMSLYIPNRARTLKINFFLYEFSRRVSSRFQILFQMNSIFFYRSIERDSSKDSQLSSSRDISTSTPGKHTKSTPPNTRKFAFALLLFLWKFVFYLPQSIKYFRSAFDRMLNAHLVAYCLLSFAYIQANFYLYYFLVFISIKLSFRASSGKFWFSLAKNKRLQMDLRSFQF